MTVTLPENLSLKKKALRPFETSANTNPGTQCRILHVLNPLLGNDMKLEI
jgi:hypothetical protein